MKTLTNKEIKSQRSYNIGNRYRVGYDSISNGSQQAYALWDKKKNNLRYITNKKWKVKMGLLLAKLFGWQIVVEK